MFTDAEWDQFFLRVTSVLGMNTSDADISTVTGFRAEFEKMNVTNEELQCAADAAILKSEAQTRWSLFFILRKSIEQLRKTKEKEAERERDQSKAGAGRCREGTPAWNAFIRKLKREQRIPLKAEEVADEQTTDPVPF